MNKETKLFIQWILDHFITYSKHHKIYSSGSKHWKFDSIDEMYYFYLRFTNNVEKITQATNEDIEKGKK